MAKNSKEALTRIDVVTIAAVACLFFILSLSIVADQSAGGDASVCVNNLRSMTLGWRMYADDHDGILPKSNSSGIGEARRVPEWSGINGADRFGFAGGGGSPGWLDLPINHEGEINPEITVRHSILTPYMGRGVDVWKCPSDRSVGSWENYQNGARLPRVRSYSMNTWMGTGGGWTAGSWRVFEKADDIVDPDPSNAFVIMDERADSINDGVLQVDMSGYPNNEAAFRIIDYPSMYHQQGAVVSFADGHVSVRRWTDFRTMPMERPGQYIALNVASPGNPDVRWLQEHSSSRRESFEAASLVD